MTDFPSKMTAQKKIHYCQLIKQNRKRALFCSPKTVWGHQGDTGLNGDKGGREGGG